MDFIFTQNKTIWFDYNVDDTKFNVFAGALNLRFLRTPVRYIVYRTDNPFYEYEFTAHCALHTCIDYLNKLLKNILKHEA